MCILLPGNMVGLEDVELDNSVDHQKYQTEDPPSNKQCYKRVSFPLGNDNLANYRAILEEKIQNTKEGEETLIVWTKYEILAHQGFKITIIAAQNDF